MTSEIPMGMTAIPKPTQGRHSSNGQMMRRHRRIMIERTSTVRKTAVQEPALHSHQRYWTVFFQVVIGSLVLLFMWMSMRTVQPNDVQTAKLDDIRREVVQATAYLSKEGRSKSEQAQPADTTTRNEKKNQSFNLRDPGDMNPADSQPPNPIPLFQTDSAAIRKRHECIQKIRERQNKTLAPLIESNTVNRRALLVDPAYHKNVGDHMLTLGELIFLHRLGYNKESFSQCNYVQAGSYFPLCEQILEHEDPNVVAHSPALWHAGGNWGDLWRIVQEARTKSFAKLLQANHTIISMPQSLHFDDSTFERQDTDKIKDTVDLMFADKKTAPEKLIFTWREQASFEKAIQLYPFATNLVVPDIAFQLGPYAAQPPSEEEVQFVDLVILLRDDRESALPQRDRETVRRILHELEGGARMSFSIVDWPDRLDRFNSRDYFFTDTSIQLLRMGRVVLCDRLHAAILAYLSGLPFVFIDQSTGKISKTLRLAFDSWEGCQDGETAMWAHADNLKHGLELAVSFLDKYELKKRQRRRRKHETG